jgi:hypothetical protein
MTSETFIASMMDAETGGNGSYLFDAQADLLDLPTPEVIAAFIKHLSSVDEYSTLLSFHIEHSVKKNDKKVLLATGSLVMSKGEIPFLLMISPKNRNSLGAEH